MELQDKLMRQAAATLDYTPSEAELHEAVEQQIQTMEAQLAQRGLRLEDYCKFAGATPESLREDARADAEQSLRTVSYTHLDVYKRQVQDLCAEGERRTGQDAARVGLDVHLAPGHFAEGLELA